MRQINFPVTMTDIIVCTPTTQNIQDVAFKTQNILFLESRCYVKAIRRLPQASSLSIRYFPFRIVLKDTVSFGTDFLCTNRAGNVCLVNLQLSSIALPN